MSKCKPNERIFTALLTAADRIGAANRKYYMAMIKRNRRGQVTKTYSLTEDHQRVMKTIDKYARCKIGDEAAMAVLHEYGVFKARTSKH